MPWIPVLLIAVCLGGCAAGEPEADAVPPASPAPELYLAGDGELWAVDTRTGSTRHRVIEALRPGDPPHRIVRRQDRFVAFGSDTFALRDIDEPVETLAQDTWFFIPGSREDRIWVAYLAPGRSRTSAGLAAISEMTIDGETTVARVPPPGGRWPVAAVDSGVVFGDDRGFVLWDPVSRRELRRLPAGFIGPGRRDMLALAHPDECGELLLIDASTGRERRVAPLAPRTCWRIFEAEFSPDGRDLAIAFTRGLGFEGTHELALIDVAAATARVVPGSQVPGGYVFTTWSADGRHVFITGGDRFEPRVILGHRLGAAAARAVPARVGDFYDVAAR